MDRKIGWNRLSFFIGSAAAAGVLGCSNRAVRQTSVPETPPKSAATPDAGGSEEAREPSMRGSMLHAVADVRAVRFSYDSAALTDEARAILDANAGWLKEHQEARVQVAGHCDPRGTEAYNLALGQRRAQSVREFYRGLGIPGTRVATISYGKDKPLCSEESESCWSSERRAETLVAFPQDVSRSDVPRRR